MTQLVDNLVLVSKFSDDQGLRYRGGKIFAGVLGVEYSIPYFTLLNGPEATVDLLNLPATRNPPPQSLFFSYAKRTANPEEFTFSDGVLPIYLRFQPDLNEPLSDASQNVNSGPDYMAQRVLLEQPRILITGKIAVHAADGSITFQSRTVDYTIPVNPPSRRIIELSLQAGLIAYLAHVR